MKELLAFARTTVIGGLLVILPVALSVVLFGKAVAAVFAIIEPVGSSLPAGTHFARLLSLLLVIGTCFATGLVVQTRIGSRVNRWFESTVLERIPGFTLLRSLTRRFTGEESDMFAVALAVIEEALVPAFIVEEHPDGSLTVFVPAVPTPTVGSLYILPKERVHRIDVPFAKAVQCVMRWGAGSRELLEAMPRS